MLQSPILAPPTPLYISISIPQPHTEPPTQPHLNAVGAKNGLFYSVDSVSGAKNWQFTAADSVVCSPTVALDGTICELVLTNKYSPRMNAGVCGVD